MSNEHVGDAADTPVFQVIDIGMTLDADGGYWPTAVIDVGPGDEAISDLARVHAVEGIGGGVGANSLLRDARRLA